MLSPPASSGISSYYNTDSWLALVSEHIESLSKSLRVLSLDIHDHPEIRNKEFHAHEILTRFIKEQKLQDWVVTPSAYGIATAFVAVFDSGRKGPVVSFNAEYGELGLFLIMTSQWTRPPLEMVPSALVHSNPLLASEILAS
jgi:hypothetical protein